MGIRVRYLRALARHLEKLAELPADKRLRRFSMYNWLTRSPCGTAACAFGEATFIPLLKHAGLRMSRYGRAAGISSLCATPFIIREGVKHTGTRAAEVLFGLTASEADWLFMPDAHNHTPGVVALRIRELIAKAAA